jgi:hypothetical protein
VRKTTFVLLALLSFPSMAVKPDIVTVTGKYGLKFRHFAFNLNKDNVLLPREVSMQRMHDEKLDEKADNFQYGQFEVFIPARALQLSLGCKRNYIVRMNQTLDLKRTEEIKTKQALFYAIQQVREGKRQQVPVVIEFHYGYDKGCNLFFRTGSGGRYVDYVGPLRH